jgi:hypothetical protein
MSGLVSSAKYMSVKKMKIETKVETKFIQEQSSLQ